MNSMELAQSVANQTNALVQEENQKGQGYRAPAPPKPGEIMICQHCGKPMLPKDFSKDESERQWEFKWHIHWDCKNAILNTLDNRTPGLMAERGQTGVSPYALRQKRKQ